MVFIENEFRDWIEDIIGLRYSGLGSICLFWNY